MSYFYLEFKTDSFCGLSGSAIFFPPYLIKDTIFREKKITERKMCVVIFSTIMPVTSLILTIQRDIVINVHRSSCKAPINEMKPEFPRTIFEKYSNTKFHEHPFSRSQLVHSDGGTDRYADRHNEANSRFSQFWGGT